MAGWCGAVRAFARGAKPLAGNCFLVAGQWLSPSGEYRQPVNITLPRADSRPHDTQPSFISAAATPAEIPRKATICGLLKDFRVNRQIPRQIIMGACNEEHHPAAQLIGHAYHPGTNRALIVSGGSRSLCRERTPTDCRRTLASPDAAGAHGGLEATLDSLNILRISRLNAGRSSGFRLVTRFSWTTTS